MDSEMRTYVRSFGGFINKNCDIQNQKLAVKSVFNAVIIVCTAAKIFKVPKSIFLKVIKTAKAGVMYEKIRQLISFF